MKICGKCGLAKDPSEFYKDRSRKDGLAYRCKKCADEVSNAWLAKNRERRNETTRIWAKAHPEGHRITSKAWLKAHPDRRKERERLYREKWKDKHHARQAVKYALKTGKITRQPCEICGDPDTHAHHEDYSRQLSVRWLCVKHHAEIHPKRKQP